MRIVILEDNLQRRDAMKAVLEDRFSAYRIEFFVAANPMIEHLAKTGLYDVSLISLDNDLEMIDQGSGRLIDPGDGIEVAKWLSTQPAVVPVIVHTTNVIAGDRVMELLGDRGWVRHRIVPYEGETWISERWRTVVRDLIVQESPEISISSLGVQILKNGLRNRDDCSAMLKEILRAASTLLCGSPDSDQLCLELGGLGFNDNLIRMTGTGYSLLRNFPGGISVEIVSSSAEAIGRGPVISSSESLDDEFRAYLKSEGVNQVQLDVIQPTSGIQGIVFLATKGELLVLRSHRFQFMLREMRGLLELALLVSLLNESSPAASQDGLTRTESLR